MATHRPAASALPNRPERPQPVPASALPWGWRYLMCPPDHFGVLYEINRWMHTEVQVHPDLARRQWEGLVASLRLAGATVETIAPVAGLPDMVFTANLGLVDGGRVVTARFRHPQRQPESGHAAEWFRRRGFSLAALEASGASFEGAGDALPFGGRLLAGYGERSDLAAHASLGRLLGVEVVSLQLVDPRFYHVDLTFCPLDERRALVNPYGWSAEAWQQVQALVPEPLVLELDEALAFCANTVVVGRTAIMPACTPRLGRRLERHGFDVCVSPVGEFQKAGGAVRCLTLALDPVLSAPAPRAG